MKNWNPITTEQQVKDIVAKSNDKPQIIFKDSVTCGISSTICDIFQGRTWKSVIIEMEGYI